MATLKSNGKCIAEMRICSVSTDGADADEMRRETVTIYRAMESGKILKKTASTLDYGTGETPRKYSGSWKVAGKVKRTIFSQGPQAVKSAFIEWADEVRTRRGIDAEVS